jgi:ABC-type polar amino acid transport system ATPase subunit
MTMVVVTHDMSRARDTAYKIFMNDGLVVDRRAPEEILRAPKEPRAQFLASVG